MVFGICFDVLGYQMLKYFSLLLPITEFKSPNVSFILTWIHLLTFLNLCFLINHTFQKNVSISKMPLAHVYSAFIQCKGPSRVLRHPPPPPTKFESAELTDN
jgi:hypothetical protein